MPPSGTVGEPSDAPLTGATLERLRQALLDLKPVGRDGFEGLLTTALSAVTGLCFRLARSGQQSGRDATSDPSPFAIAIEAKRYDGSLRTEDLAGKAVLAAHDLADVVDLWVLGATTEVGEATVLQVREILEHRGIALLVLDWTTGPIPKLAVLLALARPSVAAWFEVHAPGAREPVDQALAIVERNPALEGQAAELRRQLDAAEIGLDALRRASAEWTRRAFGAATASRNAFGQIITVADPAVAAVNRPMIARNVADALHAEDSDVVVVRGEEGTGKTWLVAGVCLALPGEPIVMFASGRRVERLDPRDPVRSLAELLAEQAAVVDVSIDGWKRRLARWKRDGVSNALRFVLVIDGLNERPSMPWADILMAFAPELRALGGRLLATTRNEFWRRDVAPRLSFGFRAREVEVGAYTPDELRSVLAHVGAAPEQLSVRVRDFVRNPRVCSVAMRMLGLLSLQPGDLTIERLLLNYWRFRLEERGDLVGHDVRDFERLLRSHASAWLKRPGISFERDEWLLHSGAARRGSRPGIVNDLTEIEEGRFLQVAADGTYQFRKEALPFALALLLTDEVKKELQTPDVDADERVARVIDPIRGFDMLAEILVAAVGLACSDQLLPADGRRALVRAWLRLQNMEESAVEAMAAYVPENVDLFLDVTEDVDTRGGDVRTDVLVHLLLTGADDSRARAVMGSRIDRWLGRWCQVADDSWITDRDHREKRRAARATRVGSALAGLTPTEREVLATQCSEASQPTSVPFARVAARLLAGRPLAPFASSLFSWALARALSFDAQDGTDELTWVVHLNAVDHTETASAIRAIVDPLIPGASETMRRAIAIALDLIGDADSARTAREIDPPHPVTSCRAVDRFCETNPYDPAAAPGANLAHARDAIATLAPAGIFTAFTTTAEDLLLEELVPALARFEPTVVEAFLRAVVMSASGRAGMPLRQLSLHLPALSPLFGDAERAAVAATITRIASAPEVVAANPDFVLAKLIGGLLPHLGAGEQLRLLLQMRALMPMYRFLGRVLVPMDAATLEASLERARGEPRPDPMRWTLFFAAESRSPLTQRSREIVIEQASSPDEGVAAAACAVICEIDDTGLSAMAVEVAPQWSTSDARSWRAGAVATAVAQQCRHDLLRLVAPAHLTYVAGVAGGRALDVAMDATERALLRLLKPINVRTPSTVTISVGPERRGPGDWRSFEESPRTRSGADAFAELAARLNGPDEAQIRRYDEDRERLRKQFEDFERALAAEGAEALLDAPPRHAVAVRMSDRDPVRVRGWMDDVLATTDDTALSQARNLAAAVAGGYAHRDARMAASVLRRLRQVWTPIHIVVGRASIGVFELAVFSGPREEAFDSLRTEAMERAANDQSLETLVAAAESCGAASWIDVYVSDALRSSVPARHARALTVAGLRASNAQSDDVLRREWGHGIAGDAASRAATNYRRHRWALHWFELARTANSPTDFWRYGHLAVGVCDWRLVASMDACSHTQLLGRFGAELRDRMVRQSEKQSAERAGHLFGQRAPDRELYEALLTRRDAPRSNAQSAS